MNPNNDDNSGWRETEIIGLEGGVVTTVESHDPDNDNRGHVCWVSPDTYDGDELMEIGVSHHGSLVVPNEGQRVLFTRRNDTLPTVVATRYEEGEEVPAYEPGERRVSHPASDSYVHFYTDGSIEVYGHNGNTIELKIDGSIVLNGGTNSLVTDVSTTTDSDGHVTSISLTKSSDIYVP
jgi:hypothetical protein